MIFPVVSAILMDSMFLQFLVEPSRYLDSMQSLISVPRNPFPQVEEAEVPALVRPSIVFQGKRRIKQGFFAAAAEGLIND